jgi:capsular polysaccharide biosynthesis protein
MYNTPNHAGPPEDRQFVSIRDVARSLRRRLWIIILVPLVIVGTTIAVSLLSTTAYEASATVMVGQEQGQSKDPARVEELQALTLSAVDIITTRPVAEEATSRLGLPMDPGAVLENLTAEPTESGQLVELTYTDTDPERTQRVVNAVGEVASMRISALPMSAHDIEATVVEAASVPRAPEEPDPFRNGILAAMMGSMLGFGVAFLMEVAEPSGKPRGKTG